MPPYSDVYVLSPERSAKAAVRFLDAFAPQREQSAVDYRFPQYSDHPSAVFASADQAIWYCEANPTAAQSVYFRNLGDGPDHVMVFFTEDGGLIVGVSVTDGVDEWLSRLREHTGSAIGYITFETPPAATEAEFRKVAASVEA